jgi:predicted AlkP superfamily phosphohydrolase/phosphomutase
VHRDIWEQVKDRARANNKAASLLMHEMLIAGLNSGIGGRGEEVEMPEPEKRGGQKGKELRGIAAKVTAQRLAREAKWRRRLGLEEEDDREGQPPEQVRVRESHASTTGSMTAAPPAMLPSKPPPKRHGRPKVIQRRARRRFRNSGRRSAESASGRSERRGGILRTSTMLQSPGQPLAGTTRRSDRHEALHVWRTYGGSGMMRQRVLAIGLDGFDVTLADRFMAEGQMPAFAELKKRAARFLLDEGQAIRAGLPWEHVASGLSPEMSGRWGPIDLDPSSYTAWQDGAQFAPWWAETGLRVVVFDTPFVDLRRARNTQGVVSWGSHNPGTVSRARPGALRGEFVRRFGEYPAAEWTYGIPWPSAERANLMGEALSHALDVRSRAVQWLATDRFPAWDLFFAVVSELHSGAEGLWHGVDARHPLHGHPSAAPAAAAMLDIHRALDRMLGKLLRAAGDAAILVFNTGGMGQNTWDVQSMVLLPELLYRHAFGQGLFTLPRRWTADSSCCPILDEQDDWDDVMKVLWTAEPARDLKAAAEEKIRSAARRLPEPIKSLLRGSRRAASYWHSLSAPPPRMEVGYLASYWYRDYWPRMEAFAFPSFVDGRIRINLRGRERHGIVELARYEETCKAFETLLRECRDPRTGEPTVTKIERASTANPMALADSESDLLVVWRGAAAAIEHPRLGLIGPVPLRRTGGHTPHGIAYLVAPGLEPGERDGVRPSTDVVPTIVQLLGAKPATRLAGESLMSPVPERAWLGSTRLTAPFA